MGQKEEKTVTNVPTKTTKEDLEERIGKYGYKLAKVRRCKNHDRLRIETSELVMTFSLHKHLEETSLEDLLQVILTKRQLLSEGIASKY